MRIAIVFAIAVLASMPAYAAEKTVNLFIPEMTCAACPIIVKSAISKVPGVQTVNASFETRTATVKFDDQRTTIEAVVKAAADFGYTATVVPPKG